MCSGGDSPPLVHGSTGGGDSASLESETDIVVIFGVRRPKAE